MLDHFEELVVDAHVLGEVEGVFVVAHLELVLDGGDILGLEQEGVDVVEVLLALVPLLEEEVLLGDAQAGAEAVEHLWVHTVLGEAHELLHRVLFDKAT